MRATLLPVFHSCSRTMLAAAGAAVLAVLTGCSTTSPDVIKPGDAQRLSQVADAIVVSVRPVKVEGSQSGLVGTAGAVVGGIGGSMTSGHNRKAAAAAVVGAMVGGVAGNAAERFGTRESAIEILLQMPSGERQAIVQGEGSERFKPGDAVILVTTGGKTRAILARKGAAPSAMVR